MNKILFVTLCSFLCSCQQKPPEEEKERPPFYRFRVDMLVRDKMYDIMISSGMNPRLRFLDSSEYHHRLLKHLQKTAGDIPIARTKKELFSTLVDLIELGIALGGLKGIKTDDIMDVLDDLMSQQHSVSFPKKIKSTKECLENILKSVEEFSKNHRQEELRPKITRFLELIADLIESKNLSLKDMAKLSCERRLEQGSFEDRICIDFVDIPEGNSCLYYYKKHPKEHPILCVEK